MPDPINTTALTIAQKDGQVVRAAAATLQAMQHLESWQTLLTLGAGMRASGLLPPELNSDEKVAMVLLKGLTLGIEPAVVAEYVDVIKGRPFVRAEMVRALVARSGVGRIEVLESSPTRAVCRGVRPGWQPCVVTYTIEDAQRAGLLNNPTYKNHPGDMLVARASVRVGRRLFADVLAGMDVSAAGEELDTLNNPLEDGTVVIEGEAVEVAQERPSTALSPEESASLNELRATADVSWDDIGRVLGGTPTQARIRQWLEDGHTLDGLVSRAADLRNA